MDDKLKREQCAFCDKTASYTCPKCSQFYCSLKCYKSEMHGQCSETFYQQNVRNNLPTTSTKDEQRHLVEVLEKFNMNDGTNTGWRYELSENMAEKKQQIQDEWDDELNEAEIAELEQMVDESTVEELWEMLTEEEKKEFKHMISRNQEV